MTLLQLSDHWIHRTYGKRQILIHAGEPVSRFHYLEKGYIKVYSISDEGEERVLLILKPGDLFPLLKDPESPVQATPYFYAAMTEVDFMFIEQREIIEKLQHNLEASWELLRYTGEFSSILTSRLTHLESKKVDDKLSKLFSYLVLVCGKPTKLGVYRLDLKLTHQDLANLIGVTRETVSVAMKHLEREQLIAHHNGFLLIDKSFAQET